MEKQLWMKKLFHKKETGILIGLIALFVFFSIASGSFLTLKNQINILRQVSLLGIMAMGMTMVISTGEFDLSVGSTFGLAANLTATFMSIKGFNVGTSILLGLLAGLAVGIANGVLVTYGHIPSFIVTLGMLNIARGVALVVTDGLAVVLSENTVPDIQKVERFFFFGGGGKINGFPVMVFYFIVIIAVGYFIFHKTILGFRMKAVGGNANAARVAGINVYRVKITAFAILGLFSALAGIVNLAFLTNAQGTTGEGYELDVIAATVIGGCSVSGGEGSILGTVIGVLMMGILKNGLILIGVSSFVQKICIGAVIIGAVAVDFWTKKKK